MRSLTKANHRSFDETVKRDGRILSVAPRTVSADEKTMPVRRTRCEHEPLPKSSSRKGHAGSLLAGSMRTAIRTARPIREFFLHRCDDAFGRRKTPVQEVCLQ